MKSTAHKYGSVLNGNIIASNLPNRLPRCAGAVLCIESPLSITKLLKRETFVCVAETITVFCESKSFSVRFFILKKDSTDFNETFYFLRLYTSIRSV